MRVPFEWLCELAGIDASVDEVAQRLTNAGLEVETIHRTGAHWCHIVVGKVDRIDPHPNADRLSLPTITTGDIQVQVVCGASNFKVGDKIAFANEGALLYDPRNPTPELKELKTTTIRGVPSRGMLCSALELGLSEDHDGIVVLDQDAPIGRPLAEVLGDEVVEFELKANRPDVLSMVGIAREAAALYESQYRPPTIPVPKDSLSASLSVNLDIPDPDLCPRYSAAFVVDVEVTESPAWLRKRLDLAGLRPINTIVDVTNYVMLELGQPLHAFDWDTLRGGLIGVRKAKAGERLVTLDGQDRELTPDTLCIVDAEGPIALAGIMGGLATEVTARTKTVVIESATFNPISVRLSAHRLALRSEASRRFEKRLPPELTTIARYLSLAHNSRPGAAGIFSHSRITGSELFA
jgi:phenylalanyl-tRNA synthetase beta chain